MYVTSEIGLVAFFSEVLFCHDWSEYPKRVIAERSIFADDVTYQFINLNGKLNGSRKDDMHGSMWNENDSSHRLKKGVSVSVFVTVT